VWRRRASRPRRHHRAARGQKRTRGKPKVDDTGWILAAIALRRRDGCSDNEALKRVAGLVRNANWHEAVEAWWLHGVWDERLGLPPCYIGTPAPADVLARFNIVPEEPPPRTADGRILPSKANDLNGRASEANPNGRSNGQAAEAPPSTVASCPS
jgi:hypothetical protein